MESATIGQKAAQTLYHAFELAAWLKLPLNTHVTINFANTSCPPQVAVKAFARLRRDYYGKWCRRHPDNKSRHDPTGVYAFENARDGKPILEVDDNHNIHVHWALHVPPHLAEEFACEVERWVEVVTGCIRDEFAVRITTRPPKVMRRYLLKGIRELWAETYGAKAKPQGTIVGGRRTGTSN